MDLLELHHRRQLGIEGSTSQVLSTLPLELSGLQFVSRDLVISERTVNADEELERSIAIDSHSIPSPSQAR